MENSKIAWTHHTFNPWRGCTKVSEGCQHCYAETMSHRNPEVLGEWGPNGTRIVAASSAWNEPAKWNRVAGTTRTRARVFCASLADVFEGPETMPDDDGEHGPVTMDDSSEMPNLDNESVMSARVLLFKLIESTPHLDWLLLTKRPENVMPIYATWLHWHARLPYENNRRRPNPPPSWPPKFPDNVWIGCTAENQKRAEQRIPQLIQIPARVRFVSVEPQLENVDLRPWLDREKGVNWVISGGESHKSRTTARPFNTDWARNLRDMCGDAGVPFFFKQTGSNVIQLTVKGKGDTVEDLPEDLRIREFPT